MPPTTQSFIKRLARLAPQLGSSGSPSSQLADQAGGAFFPGPTTTSTTTPWGGGGTFTPPTTTQPPNRHPAAEFITQSAGSPSGPTTPAQTTGNFAPSSTLTPPDRTPPTGAMPELSGSGTATGLTGGGRHLPAWTPPDWFPRLVGGGAMGSSQLNDSSKPADFAEPASSHPATLSELPAVTRESYTDGKGQFDSDAYLAAQKNRLVDLAKFYNLSSDQTKAILSEVDNQVAAATSDGTDPTKVAEAAFITAQKNLITGKGTITGVTDQTSTGAGGAGGGTPMSGSQIVSAATQSPFAQYGVYTPDQQIAMQAMIGNYVQSQDQRFAAGGGHLDPKISAAYMEQAQAMPAIKAFEGQAQLAKQNQDLQAQYDNLKMQYQLQQWMQSQANQSGGATSSADFTATLDSTGLTGGGS